MNRKAWAKALNVLTASRIFWRNSGSVAVNHLPNVPVRERMEGSIRVYYNAGRHHRGECNQDAAIVKRNRVDDRDIVSIDEIKEHTYYQEFCADGFAIVCGN